MTREILFKGFCPNENGKEIITLKGENIRGDWREGYYSLLKTPNGWIDHHILANGFGESYRVLPGFGKPVWKNHKKGWKE